MSNLYKKLHEYRIKLTSEPVGWSEQDFIFTYECYGKTMRAIYNFTRIDSERAVEILMDDVEAFINAYNLKPIPYAPKFEMEPKDPRLIQPL